MVILISHNRITDFLLTLAWLSRFNPLSAQGLRQEAKCPQHWFRAFKGGITCRLTESVTLWCIVIGVEVAGTLLGKLQLSFQDNYNFLSSDGQQKVLISRTMGGVIGLEKTKKNAPKNDYFLTWNNNCFFSDLMRSEKIIILQDIYDMFNFLSSQMYCFLNNKGRDALNLEKQLVRRITWTSESEISSQLENNNVHAGCRPIA